MSEINLKQLLLTDSSQSMQVVLDTSETQEDLRKIHEEIKQQISETSWDSIQTRLFEHLEDLLDVPMGPILANGWNKLRKVRQVIQKQKQSGSLGAEEVALFDHALKSVHYPKLQILINGKLIQTLTLSVELKLQLYGVMLEIQQGRIEKIKTGKCTGKGTISYQGALLHESKIPAFQLPGSVSMTPVIREEAKQLDLFAPETQMQQKSGKRIWLFYLISGLIALLAAFYFWRFL